jgi:hypothetical protein
MAGSKSSMRSQPPGRIGAHHALQRPFPLRDVDEDETGMNEIEDALGWVGRGDIVSTNLDIPAGNLLCPRHVNVH